jgi:polysaccharide export outer membrane protein
VRIASSGDINLQMVGRIRAAGMKVEELETELAERLKVYIKEPQVVVSLVRSNSEPVSVLGAVARPGIVQLEGQKTLIEVISLAGGLTTDAAPLIKITRRSEWGAIPLQSARTEGAFSIAEINYTDILNTTRPEENIQVLPQDVISVPRAPLIYVIGDVRSPGGFVLNGKITVSLIEALARAGGTNPTAQDKEAKIIRPVPGANRIEIAVNLKQVLAGKTKDMMLQPEDILYVPSSAIKSTLRRTVDQVIGTTLGVAMYRF